ncbi:MAG TPA: universal stress protein [Blastocatellia bacterium]|nr:universal stress protein [Blastocatellia bacterium]
MVSIETTVTAHLQCAILPSQLSWSRIFHPTDFSDASAVAFAHALKFATLEHGRLTIMHTEKDAHERHWSDFPRVRQTLEQWNILPPNAPRESFAEIGLQVEKVSATHSNTEEPILHYLHKHPHDLIVLATHQYRGLERLTHKTIAESVARHSGEMTLFLPEGVAGFVSLADGSVNLKHILIPVDHVPHPQIALEAAASMVALLSCSDVLFTVLHIGPSHQFPAVKTYPGDHWKWEATLEYGDLEEQILRAAEHGKADLIVMATEGHHGFLDALRGSTTERIVRAADCPVLAVPVGGSQSNSFQEMPVWSSVE